MSANINNGRGRGTGDGNKKLTDWIEFSDDQARSRQVLSDGTVFTKCDQCRQAYSERNPPEEPPCDTCWVDLMPENRQAAEVYLTTRNQFITAGMGQVIDISIPAVKIVMDLYPGGITDQWKCLSKVRTAFNRFKPTEEKP